MSDHLERVTAYLDALDSLGDVGPEYIDPEIIAGAPTHDAPYLSGSDLRALVADAKQLRAQGTEYGIRADFIDTTSGEFTVADNLDDALRALDEFDAKYGGRVLGRALVQRQVGGWQKVGGER